MITTKPYLTKLNELIEIDENPKWLDEAMNDFESALKQQVESFEENSMLTDKYMSALYASELFGFMKGLKLAQVLNAELKDL